MERRNLFAGFAVLVISSVLLAGAVAGSASAHKVSKKTAAGADPPTCIVGTSPKAFTAQGEFGEASSVATIVEVSCETVYAFHKVKLSSQELYNRCKDSMSWSEAPEFEPTEGPSFTIGLDGEGNGSAVIWAGPGCASGESLVSAHLVEAPYTTVTTAFTVVAPKVTTPGVTVWPSTSVEDNILSSVETIVEVEFPPVYAEKNVNISDEQLFAQCGVAPHLEWIGPDEDVLGVGVEGVTKVKLDNDGNAFVVLLGGPSCASGPTEVEASLEVAPYTTKTTTFTVAPPEAGI
jgi:hypothetical protein